MSPKSAQITFGEQLKKLDVGGFVLTETLHSPSVVLPRHEHECANLVLTLKGSFREVIGSRPQEPEPLSILVKPAGESHANRYGGAGAHCLVIEVKAQQLESVARSSKLFSAPAHIRGGPLPVLAVRIYDEFRARHDAAELMIEGLILEMMAEATRRAFKDDASPAPPRWLGEVRDFIHENFNGRVCLAAVAAAVEVNPTYLARTFRRHYGRSIGEYVKHLRLEFAARELTDTPHPLAEIAAAAGFYDQSHFTHAFRQHTKMTPAEFRAAARGGKARTTKP